MATLKRFPFAHAACGALLSAVLLAPALDGSMVQLSTSGNGQNQNPPAPAQQPGQTPAAAPAAAPAPLFQGKTNLKSSRQTKDSASAGFNGIGPSGEIDKKLLASSATSEDESKAYQLSNFSVSKEDLNTFIAAGHLSAAKK